jgi:hypothetical protein
MMPDPVISLMITPPVGPSPPQPAQAKASAKKEMAAVLEPLIDLPPYF